MTTLHPVNVPRPGGVKAGASSPSPGVLLPSGGGLPPPPVPAPTRALVLDAIRLTRALRDPARRPARWSHPAFGREVEMIRRHLSPVHSRRGLAASYGREAFHILPTIMERNDPGPIRLAYALRWLELRDGVAGPTWTAMIGDAD